MNAIRELLEFIVEQAVAADLGRRLLQDAVTAREAQIRRAIKAEKEVDRLTHRDAERMNRLLVFAGRVCTILPMIADQDLTEEDKADALQSWTAKVTKALEEVTTCDA